MRVEIENNEVFSRLLNHEVENIKLINDTGVSVELLSYGCTMLELNVPDSNGVSKNILMTYKALEGYVTNPYFLNATVGINAGRLKDGKFSINDDLYTVDINEGVSNLHGGVNGLHKKFWAVGKRDVDSESCSVTLLYKHKDLEDGFPGNIDISADFKLTRDNELEITYTANADRTCLINLANHNYYNLSGDEERTIDNQLLFINAKYYKELDSEGIPIEEMHEVKNSVFDFSESRPIKNSYVSAQGGIDHPFAVSDSLDNELPAIVLKDPISNREMSIETNQECVVIYTNNVSHKNHMGICFEAQGFPNQAKILNDGEEYLNKTIYRFK